MRKFWILKVIMIGIVAVLFFGFAVMLLWNWLVPALFGGPLLTFWQALGLLILSKILFSGIGRRGHPGRHGPHEPFWKKRLKDKWERMSPEQREKFKARFKHRCDKWGWKLEEEPASIPEQKPAAGTQSS